MSEIPVYNAVPEEQDKQEALLALRAAQRREKGPKTTDTKPSRKSTVDGSLQLIVDNNDRSPGLHTQDGALRDKKTEYDSYLMNLDRGDPFSKTKNRVWTKQGSETVWIRDMLPKNLGPTRIHLYEYKTAALKDLFGGDLNQLIRGHAKRLLKCIFDTLKELNIESIILVGKGFGGLISKLAVVISAQKSAALPTTANAAGGSAEFGAVQTEYLAFSQQHISGIIFLGTPHRGWRNSHGYTYYTHATPPKQLEKPITGRASSSDSNTSAPVIVTPPTPTEKSTGISHDCTTLPAIAGVLASNLSNCVGTDVDRMGFTAVQNSSTEQPECSSLTPDVTSSSFDTTIELNQIEAVQDSPKLSPSISSSNERLITPNKNEEIVSNSSDQTEDQLLAKMEGLTQQLQEETRRRKWDPLHTAESSFLAKLSRDFSQVCDEYEILSVFAVKASRFTKSTVGKFSALLDMHNETVQGLDVKHEDLVRYDNEEDRIYSELQDAICKFTSRVKLRSIRSQEETTQENRTVQTNQMPSGFRRSMTMRPIRRKSSMAPEGGNVDAIESAKENQQIKNLVERFFPVGVNFPAETVDVTLGWSEQGVYFHDFEPKHHSLHLLAPEMFVTEQKEAESYDNSEFDADHTTLKGGFFWVHVPGNDRAWAQDVVSRIHAFRYPNLPLEIMCDDYWKYKERRHTYGKGYYHRYMEPSCCTIRMGPDFQLALYMPYLHWSDHKEHENRSIALEAVFSDSTGQKGKYERSKIDPSKRLRSISVLGDLCHHPRRTLDKFYYRSIETKTRDNDQIVSRKRPDQVLMVDQLWVWVTSMDTIFTFFPQNTTPEMLECRSFADLKSSLHEYLQSSTGEEELCRNAVEMTAECLYHAVTVLLAPKPQKDNGLSVQHIFQEIITETTENAVTALNSFVLKQGEHLTIDKELEQLQRASDLEDELRILLHLFHEQRKVINSFISQVEEESQRAADKAKDALQMIDEFENDLTKQQRDARAAKESLICLLDLKQKKANLEEARATHELTDASRKEQQESVEQGRTMMIFTVFTIVFLPLSFFTSLYGMNLREWSGESKNTSARSVALYMGTISTVVIVIALVLAFWYRKVQQLVSKFYNRIRGKKGGNSSSEGQRLVADTMYEERTGGRQCTV